MRMMGYSSKQKEVIKSNFLPVFIMILLGIAACYYNTLFDLIVLGLLLLSAYSIGMFFDLKLGEWPKMLVQTVLGIGLIGFIVYYLLLAGYGSRSFYLLVLIIPIIVNRKKLLRTAGTIRELYMESENKYFILFTALWLGIYFVCGITTIHNADGLAKYMSVVNYAAENGCWRIDVTESIIFADLFSMFCALTTIGVSLGADRFYIWTATMCMCFAMLLLLEFVKMIYPKANRLFMVIVFLTTPMFLKLGLDLSMDFAQVMFLLAAITAMADMEKETVWKNIYVICLLSAAALLSKLTSSYVILAYGFAALVMFFWYAVENKLIIQTIKKVCISAVFLFVPLTGPVCYGMFFYGSPVMPWMNDIFKSPYAAQEKFIDPFQNSPYGFNLQTLRKIILHTSQNMEIADGSVGIFLLFILLFPFGLLLYRNKKYICWTILAFLMFKASAFFTYNLRYYIAILVIFLALVNVTCAVLLQCLIKNKYVRNAVWAVLIIVSVIPNIFFIYKNQQQVFSKNKGDIIYEDEQARMLNENISEKDWVFGINSVHRGEWTGKMYSNTWYNHYLSTKMEQEGIGYQKLLSEFDYVICNKFQTIYDEEILQIIQDADTQDSVLETYREGSGVVIYKVRDTLGAKTISTDEPVTVTENVPYVYEWENTDVDRYALQCEIENGSEEDIIIKFQVIYYDEEHRICDYVHIFVTVKPGIQNINCDHIRAAQAAYTNFSVSVYQSSQEVTVRNLELYVEKDRSFLNSLKEDFYARTPF